MGKKSIMGTQDTLGSIGEYDKENIAVKDKQNTNNATEKVSYFLCNWVSICNSDGSVSI